MNSRRQYIKGISCMLLILFLISSVPSYAATFPDVSESHWAYQYVEKMVKLGIINGYDDGTFKPKNSLTFLENIKLISGLVNLTPQEKTASSYAYSAILSDLNVPDWARESLEKCLYKGVISETELRSAHKAGMLAPGTKFVPARIDVSVWLGKAMGFDKVKVDENIGYLYKDLKPEHQKYKPILYLLINAGVLNNEGMGDYYFEPSSAVLREQMTKMLATAYDYLQSNNPDDTPKPDDPPKTAETEVIRSVVNKVTTIGANSFITIIDRYNEEVAYIIDSKTTITVDNKAASIAQIVEGQDVEITTLKNDKTAISVKATSVEEDIEGIVKSISPSSYKITVEYQKDRATKTMEFSVDRYADITLSGKDADLYDIKVGDKVYLVTKNHIVLEIEGIPQSGKVSGVIKSIDSEKIGSTTIYYITVTDSKNVSREYEIDSKAYIYRNNRSAKIEDLKVGDEVDLILKYDIVMDIDAYVVEREIEGYVVGMNTRLNKDPEIFIKNKETKKEEGPYIIISDAIIKIDNVTGSARDIREGYYVELVVEGDEIVELYADSRGSESSIYGKIKSISSKNKSFVLIVDNFTSDDIEFGEEITIYTAPDVIITDRRLSKLDFSYLTKGDILSITGYYDGSSFIADTIMIR